MDTSEHSNLYAELRFSSEVLKKSFSENELLWLRYFYNANVPAVKTFVDSLIMEENKVEELAEAFKGDLGALIEHQLKDLLAVDGLLDKESKSFLLKHLPESPEIFSVLTKRYADPKSLNSLEAVKEVISKIKKEQAELMEKAKTGEGLERFMQLCDTVANEMGRQENCKNNPAKFMESINNLIELKTVVNPEDVKKLINTILYETRNTKETTKRKGYVQLLKALEIRDFFKQFKK